MVKIAHITDPHFNFIVEEKNWSKRDQKLIKKFADNINVTGCDICVITGDITEAPYIEQDLYLFSKFVQIPIYFVLGNHDYYNGSFEQVKNRMVHINHPQIKWLGTDDEPIKLNETTCLVGDDGWYDVRAGAGVHSRLLMNDPRLIHDFRNEPHIVYASMSRDRALKSAERIEKLIKNAFLKGYQHVYVATHVPPFLEAALSPKRQISDHNWAPYMTNISLGDMLIQVAEENRDKEITILCGHTHTDCQVKPWHNLNVRVGKGEYTELLFDVIEI